MLTIKNYTVIEQIYESQNSRVYRGMREVDKQAVILKLLQAEYPTPQQLTVYRQEYEMIGSLTAVAGVVKVYELLPYRHSLVMILEDFGGQSLKSMKLAGAVSLELFLKLAIQLSELVGQVHQSQIMHKDMNPSNVVYNPATQIMKLIDFGISSRLSREYMTFRNANNLEGTLAYISPEQTGRMNRVVDYRTDLYSLGVMLYELWTGKLPFEELDPLALVHAHIARQPVPPLEQLRVGVQYIDPPQLTPYTIFADILLSDIIMKLLAKNAEDRYQSAYGVKYDLEQIQTLGVSSNLPPTSYSLLRGQRDFSGRFQLPQKLYGREAEIEILLNAFARVAKTESKSLDLDSTSELLLVAGYSGVGKSALVYEIHKPITAQRGHFIQGKFDQLQRNIPYFALTQAFEGFVKLLLTKSEAELQTWRVKIQQAAGNIGRVLIDLIPSLQFIIETRPDVPDLDGVAAQNRFYYAMKNLVKAMAQADHPLVMFIDDWQWADLPSINLLETLLLDKNIEHLLVIAAYRDNEVNAAHPLMVAVENLEKAGSKVETIELHNLTFDHVQAFIMEALPGNNPTHLTDLVRLVYGKTQGNAFFVGQFLQTLYEEELLKFNFDQSAWQWNMEQIHAKGMTDNVVELLTQKVQKLPIATQQILQLAACMGNGFALAHLAVIAEKDAPTTNKALESAVLEGLLIPNQAHFQQVDLLSPSSPLNQVEKQGVEYYFAHDRIQQAAYTLISEAEKQVIHLRIGRLLWANVQSPHPGPLPGGEENLKHPHPNPLPGGEGVLPPSLWGGLRGGEGPGVKELDEQIFEITNHWNKGRGLLDEPGERLILARLNLMAGHKAKGSTAYKPALTYYQIGLELLSPTGWQTEYDLTLAFYTGAAESAWLSGDFEQMAQLTHLALSQAKTVLDKIPFYDVQIQAGIAQNNSLLALKIGLAALKELGISLPSKPTKAGIGVGLFQTMFILYGKDPKELLALPIMTHPDKVVATRLLATTISATYLAEPLLFPLVVFTMTKLSVQEGHTPHAPAAYAFYGMLLMVVAGRIEQGYQFGQLAVRLIENSYYQASQAKVILVFNYIIRPWQDHLREASEPLYRGYQLGLESGDLEYAAWCLLFQVVSKFFTGESLDEVNHQMAVAQETIKQLRQEKILDLMNMHWQVVLNWRGQAENPVQLNGTVYDEVARLAHYVIEHDTNALGYLYILKLILAYQFQAYQLAFEYAQQAELNLEGAIGSPLIPMFYFYDSLIRLALYPTVTPFEQRKWRLRVWRNQRKMKNWATRAPMNLSHKYYLVEAEWARVLGQSGAAETHYDKAIALAKEHGYLQEEALANELAGKFWFERDKPRFATLYLREAHYVYQHWGAVAKVQQLQDKYPVLLRDPQTTASQVVSHHTIITTTGHTVRGGNLLDLTAMMNAAQVISSEIRLETLLTTLMQIVMETGGAERSLLFLPRNPIPLGEGLNEAQWGVKAVGNFKGKVVVNILELVSLNNLPLHPDVRFSVSIVNYVIRARTVVVLSDARHEDMFEQDSYISQYQPKSILCIPLLKQGEWVGLVYLENNKAVDVFTPERVQLLKLLAAQAAISINNAQLLTERQETIIKLQEIDHLKTEFLTTMSHELRTPLNSILGFSDLLLEGIDGDLPDMAINDIQTIHNSGQHLLAIINDILDVTKIEAGLMEIVSEPVEVAEVVSEVMNTASSLVQHKPITLTILMAENLPLIQADKIRLKQILLDLLDNAIKFTSRGEITVQAQVSENYLEFAVKDTGIGIPPDKLEVIFEAFQQVDMSKTRSYGGIGLGLTICQRLVVMHGGRIWVESEVGKGTTVRFTVRLMMKE